MYNEVFFKVQCHVHVHDCNIDWCASEHVCEHNTLTSEKDFHKQCLLVDVMVNADGGQCDAVIPINCSEHG